MRRRDKQCRQPRSSASRDGIIGALLLSFFLPSAQAVVYPSNHEKYSFDYLSVDNLESSSSRSLTKRDGPIPLVVTNNCPETIVPGISTQHGDGPGTGGFVLEPGNTRNMSVSPTWQGRIWGRTNCTVNGDTATCTTGDCFGKLDCEFSGATPCTLAEFNLAGGVTGRQTFYDISLVDGYNLPMAIVYIPAANTSYIPPNLVNPSCIATPGYLADPSRTGTTYTNITYPMPYENSQTNSGISNWCPWDLQAFPPDKPGDGVYPYPDDQIERPVFDPCKSACVATNSPSDCCTGDYNDPNVCKRSLYSEHAKAMCPDAYSFAYDDQSSTFIIPSGGGWEVVFCPAGRSTNILSTFGPQMMEIASSGIVSERVLGYARNKSYIESTPVSSTATFESISPSLIGFLTAVAVGFSLL